MKNVHKIKIKLENIWIDLIMGIYAPYSIYICIGLSQGDMTEAEGFRVAVRAYYYLQFKSLIFTHLINKGPASLRSLPTMNS